MDAASLKKQFHAVFPDAPAVGMFFARAPGRVNLIGEHTDYNDGFVCPMAIDRETVLVAVPRNDASIRLHSILAGETVIFPVDREVPHEGPAWALYARGAAEAIRRRTTITRGFDAVVDSTVPLGGGLSSSAAFEVSTALALLTANARQMPLPALALACQWAEHTYPGVPCGIMDQFISAMGRAGHAMLLDCRDQTPRHVPLDDPGIRIVISNSNVKHALTGGEYAQRRAQCVQAVKDLQLRFPVMHSLRDATLANLEAVRSDMDPVVHRRARHVISENTRTQEFAAALGQRDYARCGALMLASHASMRDDYEISCPEIDALVEIAAAVPGVYGTRMTGGGFGGCIVALCQTAAVAALTQAIELKYPPEAGGKQATTFSTVAAAGASAGVLPF